MKARKLDRYTDHFRMKVGKALFRICHYRACYATPYFIVGAQRSGTTMLGRCLERNTKILYYPERDENAFSNFILRDDHTIESLIKESRWPIVIFKPLTDSHRVIYLMSRFGDGGAIWVYRRFEDRIKSAVTKFGSHNLDVLRNLAEGKMLESWQAQGLGAAELELVRSLEPKKMSALEASALFWYLRNLLFFKQKLDTNKKASLVSYEDLVAQPEVVMRQICKFVGCEYNQFMVKGIYRSSVGTESGSAINDRLSELCSNMYARLDQVRRLSN